MKYPKLDVCNLKPAQCQLHLPMVVQKLPAGRLKWMLSSRWVEWRMQWFLPWHFIVFFDILRGEDSRCFHHVVRSVPGHSWFLTDFFNLSGIKSWWVFTAYDLYEEFAFISLDNQYWGVFKQKTFLAFHCAAFPAFFYTTWANLKYRTCGFCVSPYV